MAYTAFSARRLSIRSGVYPKAERIACVCWPNAGTAGFGAEMREWADFALSRNGQATRRDTGMPRPVMMLMTLQATLASVFWVGRVRAWRPRPITFLYRNIATSAKERFP